MDKRLSLVIRRNLVEPVLEQKKKLLIIACALALITLSQGIIIFILKPFLDALLNVDLHRQSVPLQALVPKYFLPYMTFLKNGMIDRNHLLIGIPAIIALTGVVRALAIYYFQMEQQSLTVLVVQKLRLTIFEKVLFQPFLLASKRSPSEWMSIIMNDTQQAQGALNELMVSVVRDGVLVLSGIFFLSLIHWQSALVLMVIVPFIAWSMGTTGRKLAVYSDEFQTQLANMANVILDIRNRMFFIKAQRGESREAERFGEFNARYLDTQKQSLFLRAIFAPMVEVLGFAGLVLIFILISKGLLGSQFTSVVFLQFVGTLGLIIKNIKSIGEQVSRLGETAGVFKKSFHLLIQTAENQEIEVANRVISAAQRPATIDLRKISIGYGEKPSFFAESIVIQPATRIAIIGPSGAGKSSLVKCLAGLIAPQEWQANISWEELAAASSYVSQKPFLFNDTLKSNLCYALSQNIDDYEINNALDHLGLKARISSMPAGLETQIGSLNQLLSGGEAQRITIARGMLRFDKSLLLLDEVTSALDGSTERQVLDYIFKVSIARNSVVIAITHRIENLSLFDEVWFVEAGKIAFKGPWTEGRELARIRSFIQQVQP